LAAIGAPASTPPVVFLQQSLGLAAARAGDSRTALAHLQRARKSAPDFYEPAYNLALVWLQLGETRAALGNFFWAEIHGGDRLSVASKTRLLNLIADQFDAAGEARLAEAARRRAVSAATALPSVQ
jgi:tetratricopeptide (TPR) repeat protein